MSFNQAGKIFLISAVDGTVGVLTGSLIESICPPLANQGPFRLAAEALIQLGVLTFTGIEVARIVNRTENDPTNGLPFTWGLFVGNPNTFAKLGLLGQYLRRMATNIISQETTQSVEASAEIPQ